MSGFEALQVCLDENLLMLSLFTITQQKDIMKKKSWRRIDLTGNHIYTMLSKVWKTKARAAKEKNG